MHSMISTSEICWNYNLKVTISSDKIITESALYNTILAPPNGDLTLVMASTIDDNFLMFYSFKIY